MIDKYTWVDVGSSYLPGELQAAYLFGQLEKVDQINKARHDVWNYYFNALQGVSKEGRVELPTIPDDCAANAHMFYIKVRDIGVRSKILEILKEQDIGAVFHYIPLHSAPAGLRLGRFHGSDVNTTIESERLIRLPIWYGMQEVEMERVTTAVIGAVNATFQ
jgi:dTDP-4-amino-4,6-dideoxygalactose transaminase